MNGGVGEGWPGIGNRGVGGDWRQEGFWFQNGGGQRRNFEGSQYRAGGHGSR